MEQESHKPIVDEFVHADLYHYTTVEGFCGIIDSGRMWATSWQHLNDSTELRRAEGVISSRMQQHFERALEQLCSQQSQIRVKVAEEGGLVEVSRRECQSLIEALHRTTFGPNGIVDPYVLSFCKHDAQSYQAAHGLLSQWRAYGQGGGVAIVFDTERVKFALGREQRRYGHIVASIGDLIYDDSDAEIDKDLATLFEKLGTIVPRLYTRQQPDFGPIAGEYIRASCFIKHHAFQEEKEARIVVSPRPQHEPYRDASKDDLPTRRPKFRVRGAREVRYVELFDFDRSHRYPIKKVIIGPSLFQNRNLQVVSERMGRAAVEIVRSEIPFIP